MCYGCLTSLSAIFSVFIGWANNEVPGENYQPTTSQTLSHKVVLKDTSSGVTIRLTTLVVTGIDCIGSCKSNYHTIMATTAPLPLVKIR